MKMIIRWWGIFIIVMTFGVFAAFVVPLAPEGHILDEVWLLDTVEKSSLEVSLQKLETETQHQIGIVILQSLQGRTIEEAGLAIGRTWWVGKKWIDNGLLILIAPTEREMRIEVGYGLEWVITDLTSHRIIEEYLTPAFQKEAYFEWFGSALEVMAPLLRWEAVTLPEAPKDVLDIWFSFIVFLIWGSIFLGSGLFESSKSWWFGIFLGAGLGGIVMWALLWTLLMTLLGVGVASVVLGFADWLFSTGKLWFIKKWAGGGKWWGSGGGFGGGFWGGSSGGFGGGWFGWGGSSGKW